MYNSTVYKPSNKFSPLGIVLMFFSILAVGFIISWLYQFGHSADLSEHNPGGRRELWPRRYRSFFC